MSLSISKRSFELPQFIRFAIIGGINTATHGAILALQVELMAIPVALAHLIAFWIANLGSYFMNAFWTFRQAFALSAYLRFFSTSLLSLGLTLLIASVCEYYERHYLEGFVLIVVLVPVISFLIMKFWAFAPARDNRQDKQRT